MKASRLIAAMQDLIDEFGDLDVGRLNDEYCSFDGIKGEPYRKKAENTGDLVSDSVSDAEYFIAID